MIDQTEDTYGEVKFDTPEQTTPNLYIKEGNNRYFVAHIELNPIIEAEIDDRIGDILTVREAYEIAKDGRVGKPVGFSVGKMHFTIVKDTGYISDIKLRKRKK